MRLPRNAPTRIRQEMRTHELQHRKDRKYLLLSALIGLAAIGQILLGFVTYPVLVLKLHVLTYNALLLFQVVLFYVLAAASLGSHVFLEFRGWRAEKTRH